MTTTRKNTTATFRLKASVVMVQSALAMMACASFTTAAQAADKTDEDPAVTALTRPTSSIGIGAGSVSEGSYKFGEFNGLQEKRLYGVANFDIETRSPYDGDGTSHFRLRGDNLGLETRDLSLDYGAQGRFRFKLGYDELLHNSSDSYQTPFLGIGGNMLTLPSNWIRPLVPQVSATGLNSRAFSPVTGDAPSLTAPAGPNAAQLAILANIRAQDLPAFRNVNLQTKRSNSSVAFDYQFSPHWEFSSSFKHELAQGLRPLDAVVNGTGATGQVGGDSGVTLAEQINSTTDQLNLALNYHGDHFFGQIGYYGSLFDNSTKSMNWQDPNSALGKPIFGTISTPPSNQFHEINFVGGYNFSPTTKLVVNGAYGRNSQNDTFLTPPAFNVKSFITPAPSADALVITKAFNLRLTARPSKDWNIATGLKYNQRDNQTPVRMYIFQDVDAASSYVAGTTPAATATQSPFNAFLGGTTYGQNTNIYNNRPLSKTTNQFQFDTDYKVAKGHTLAGGYQWEKINRTCNSTWIACSDADTTNENTLKAEWRAEFSDDLSTKVSYARSARTVNYNENAWLAEVPLANAIGTGANGAVPGATMSVYDYIKLNGLTGFGPLLGFPTVALTGNAATLTPNNNIILQRYYGSRNNVSEQPGMRRFNLADRNRDKLRTSVDWQASEQLSLQASLDFNRDDYANSVYGLKEAKDAALNLDATYVMGQNLTASAFYSYENQQSGMNSSPGNISNTNPATVPANNLLSGSPCYATVSAQNGDAKNDPCNKWSATMRDKANTLGFGLTKRKMLGGKFDLSANLVFTQGQSDIEAIGGIYVANPLAAATTALALVNNQPAKFYIAAENYPTVTTNVVELHLNGEYRYDKSSAVRVGYSYQNLRSSADYAYEGLQFGGATAEMATNERVSNYSVHNIGVYYVYRFQ